MKRQRRADLRTMSLYGLRMIREFRGTLAALAVMVLFGGFLYHLTVFASLGGKHPPALLAFYASWMSVLAQQVLPPETWYLEVLTGTYPLFGFVLVGEGIVRLGMLMISRKEGEKEWMKVVASTYRD